MPPPPASSRTTQPHDLLQGLEVDRGPAPVADRDLEPVRGQLDPPGPQRLHVPAPVRGGGDERLRHRVEGRAQLVGRDAAPHRHRDRGHEALLGRAVDVVDQPGRDLVDVLAERVDADGQGGRRVVVRVNYAEAERQGLEPDRVIDHVVLDRVLVAHVLLHVVDHEPPPDAVVDRLPLVQWDLVRDRDDRLAQDRGLVAARHRGVGRPPLDVVVREPVPTLTFVADQDPLRVQVHDDVLGRPLGLEPDQVLAQPHGRVREQDADQGR